MIAVNNLGRLNIVLMALGGGTSFSVTLFKRDQIHGAYPADHGLRGVNIYKDIQ